VFTAVSRFGPFAPLDVPVFAPILLQRCFMRLQGKAVVMTGSTCGIGNSIASACAGEGTSVVIPSRSAQAVHGTAKELQAQGPVAARTVCDTTVPGAHINVNGECLL
jgi:short-subunit dehydrogenase